MCATINLSTFDRTRCPGLLAHCPGLLAPRQQWVGNARALAFYSTRGYEESGSTEDEHFENRLFAKSLGTLPKQ